MSLQTSSKQSIGDVWITQLDRKWVPQTKTSHCKSSVAEYAKCGGVSPAMCNTYLFFSNHSNHRLFSLSLRTDSTASCLHTVLQRFFVFVFGVFCYNFWVMVQCDRLSWLLSAFECTINILYLILSYLTGSDLYTTFATCIRRLS